MRLPGNLGIGSVAWNNSVFEGVSIFLDPTYYWYNQVVNCDLQVTAYNNLFRNIPWLYLAPVPASAGNWTLRDNFFDKVQFGQYRHLPLDFDHNGYWPLTPAETLYSFFGYTNQLLPTATSSGATEVFLTNAPPYQCGAFGSYYLSATTALYQAGSRIASAAGLTQYTTFANQRKDASNLPVNIGLHYVAAGTNLQPATGNVQPLDTDGDGIPDYVEVEHGTDPNNPMSDGVTNDAYNVAYDNVDLDGDGLTGAAEKSLHTNPLSPDNPLNLSTSSLSSLLSGVVTIPLQIGTNVDADEPLQLFVDGTEANAAIYKTNLNWYAVWDTATLANGLHNLSVKYCCQQSAGSSLLADFYGNTLPVAVSNLLTFSKLNSGVCDLLVIDATANNDADTYSIGVYDAGTSNLLTTLSGSVSAGMIQTNWDLTDGNGNLISTGPITCNFTLSSGGSPPATTTKTYHKFLHNSYNYAFTVAWGVDNFSSLMQNGFLLGMSDVVALLNGFFDPFPDPDLTYNILPLGGAGNVNDSGSPISFNFSQSYSDSKGVLLQALRASGNFFWVGHGKPTFIYPNLNDESTKLTAKEIGESLRNPMTAMNGSNYVVTPYKLVILFSCQAYSQAFADAFGIADFVPARANAGSDQSFNQFYLPEGRSTNTVNDYLNLGKVPQAYVGWPCNINAPDNATEVDYEQANLLGMFDLWQSVDANNQNPTISTCINYLARQEAARFPGNLGLDKIPGIFKWELSGCFNLRITDRNP